MGQKARKRVVGPEFILAARVVAACYEQAAEWNVMPYNIEVSLFARKIREKITLESMSAEDTVFALLFVGTFRAGVNPPDDKKDVIVRLSKKIVEENRSLFAELELSACEDKKR